MWENLNLNGIQYSSPKEYADAKKELDAIEYICSKMDMENPEIQLKVYYKLLEKQTLHSLSGFAFLNELRERIIASGIIDDGELKCIHSPSGFSLDYDSETDTGDESSLERDSLIEQSASDMDESIPDGKSEEGRELSRRLKDSRGREKKYKTVADYYHSLCKRCYIIIAALALIIIALFSISYYNNNLSMDEKEIELQDKYSAWAEELEAKELLLNEKMSTLNLK